jgi:hypothetical protein
VGHRVIRKAGFGCRSIPAGFRLARLWRGAGFDVLRLFRPSDLQPLTSAVTFPQPFLYKIDIGTVVST